MASPTVVNAAVASGQTTGATTLTTSAMANAALFQDTVLVAIEHASAQSISSVTDSQGNVYTKDTLSIVAVGAASFDVWIARVLYPLTTADTITVTPSASTNMAVVVSLVRGAIVPSGSTSPHDVSKNGTGTGTNTPTTGASSTLAVANELSLGWAAFTGNTTGFSADSTGYTSGGTVGNASGSIHVGTKTIAVAASPGTETYAPTLTGTPANSAVGLITLRGATTRYVDLVAGLDANNGLDFAHAKLNVSAAAALTGDIIHVAKSTDPVAAAGTATWTAGSTTVSTTSDLTASIAAKDFVTPIADGSAGWWEVSSITATTITLVSAYRPGLYGTTGAGLTMFKMTSAASNYVGVNVASNIAIAALGTNGTQYDPIQVMFGVNTLSDLRDGMTWIVNTNATRQGFFDCGRSYNNLSYLGIGRTGRGIQVGSDQCQADHCQVASSNGESFYVSANGGKFSNCVSQPVGNQFGFEHAGGTAGNLLVDNHTVLQTGSQTSYHFNQQQVAYVITNCQVDGTTNTGFFFASRNAYLYNCTANHTATGYQNNNQGSSEVTISNCVSSNATSRDFQSNTGAQFDGFSWWFNCLGNSGTVATRSNGRMYFDRYQQTTGDYRKYDAWGATLATSGANARGGSGICTELTPGQPSANIGASLGANLNSDYGTRPMRWIEETWAVPVEAGVTRTVTVYVKKSTTWNGTAAILGLRVNGYWQSGVYPSNIAIVAVGSNTILSTTYQQYTFTYNNAAGPAMVLDLALQVDGSAGSVYVDDIAWT